MLNAGQCVKVDLHGQHVEEALEKVARILGPLAEYQSLRASLPTSSPCCNTADALKC